ncbi:MAG: protein adenylyltransferase SelO [Halothece sp.]
MTTANPFLNLNYETALESLGEDYYDVVTAAEFPHHFLRFRNNQLLPLLNLNPSEVTEEDFIEAFGKFQGVHPFLALKYHGYQFGSYNPYLGDGRGFIYGQVRGKDGRLYDFGTKGSGQTPYSRTADGRLTLKGGVREVLASEALHQLGVRTSRCLSLIETGESLWREDEPSPTRASVLIRMSHSHLRFGTFERLNYLQRPDLAQKLLDHVIHYYYPHLEAEEEKYAYFYQELVQRVAELAAQWMVAGFCHGVLNTDNMSITGESFDYGPYAFIPTYSPRFTAAYFDYSGLYSYGNQPRICRWNLEKLQAPLAMVMSVKHLERGLAQFEAHYQQQYQQLMLEKLGFVSLSPETGKRLVEETVNFLQETQVPYHRFFAELANWFSPNWQENSSIILENAEFVEQLKERETLWQTWQQCYQKALKEVSDQQLEAVTPRLKAKNPQTALLRPVIESVWEPITLENEWDPFYALLGELQR